MIKPNEFDTLLRDTLREVDARTPQDSGIADRLIANAREGTAKVVPLRRRTAWVAPLIAAAAVVAVALAIVLINQRGDKPAPPSTQLPSPTHSPTNTDHGSPAPTTSTRTPAPPAPHVPGFTNSDVSYLDTREGWAVGDGKCPSGTRSNCATVLRTSDGGRSWHRIGVPAGLVSTRDYGSCGDNGTSHGPCVDQVVFATPKIGYLWSYRSFYMTTDGGKQWADLGTQRVVEVVAVGNMAVRLTTLQPCSEGCQYGVLAAPVGTTHWTKVISYSAGGGGDWQLAGGSGAGYVLEQLPSQRNDAASQALYKSTDGTHWARVTTAWPCGRRAINTIKVGFSGSLTVSCY